MASPALAHIEPIEDSDAAIAAALAEAHLPSLMCALVHLTGSTAHLDGITPVYDFFGDGQGGLSAAQQDAMRGLAVQALGRLREGSAPVHRLDTKTVRAMMDFIAGAPIPEHYVPFLLEELALEDTDTRARPWGHDLKPEAKAAFPVLIIGAGMSGLLAAIRLQNAGVPFTIVDKNAEVGGTWHENTYPGCRVDNPNHLYSYSFEPNHDWPQHFSTQSVLYAYFRRIADKYGLRRHIRFQTTVETAEWDEASGTWSVRVRTKDGASETLRARAVISAVGQLNRPRFPDIPGRESFRGPAFHSARWDHGVDLKGKRVAVIGTGASAFQFVPEIAPDVAQMTVFQRTPPWLGPTPNYHDDVGPGMKWLLRHVPYYEKWYRFWLFWMLTDGIYEAVKAEPGWAGQPETVGAANAELRAMLVEKIKEQLAGRPDLIGKVIPAYPIGGKRSVRDNGVWLDALKRPNVSLETNAIARIDATGIVTTDGTHHDFDVIIYGTGFTASAFLEPMRFTGRGGGDLHEQWAGDARAYLGITVPNFPNLFLMYGPNTNIVVNGSIIFFSECEIRYIMGLIELMLERDLKALEVKRDVHDRFNAKVDAQNAQMAWGQPGVTSWYKNEKGRVSQNWPFPLVEYWRATRQPDPADYALE